MHFSPDCCEKSFMVEMGLRKQCPSLSGAVPTIQSPAAKNTKKRPIQNEGSEQLEVADSADKRCRFRSRRALQKLEVSGQPLKLPFFATQIINLFSIYHTSE